MNTRPVPDVPMKMNQEEAEILAAFEAGSLHSIATSGNLKDARQSAQLTASLKERNRPSSRRLEKS